MFDSSTITSSFTDGAGSGGGGGPNDPILPGPPSPPDPNDSLFATDFGWLASPVAINKTGRKDFATYANSRAIHCTVSTLPSGAKGEFEAGLQSPVCY